MGFFCLRIGSGRHDVGFEIHVPGLGGVMASWGFKCLAGGCCGLMLWVMAVLIRWGLFFFPLMQSMAMAMHSLSFVCRGLCSRLCNGVGCCHFSHSTWSLVVLASMGMLFVVSGLSAVFGGAISWAMALGFVLVVLVFPTSTYSTVLSLSLSEWNIATSVRWCSPSGLLQISAAVVGCRPICTLLGLMAASARKG